MVYFNTFSLILFGFSVFSPFLVPATANNVNSVRALIHKSKYTRAHSLGDGYKFDPQDGWQTLNVTNLAYKYRREEHHNSTVNVDSANNHHLERRGKKPNYGLGETLGGIISHVWNGLKGFGKPRKVTITWYTGHDLKNPSCWANGNWAPTDSSFACATTLRGWDDRPQCFKFIELCNGPKKCVFSRVVDSCAGCQAGSRHVDLTRAAFGALADFDEGILSVQQRPATDPDEWYEDLWGPKHT